MIFATHDIVLAPHDPARFPTFILWNRVCFPRAGGENEVVNSLRTLLQPPLAKMTSAKPSRRHDRIIIHFVSCHSPPTYDAKV
jgi:hypothetical protein